MTETDVEVVRRLFAVLEGSPDVVAVQVEQMFHPDVEYREDPMWPGTSRYRGLEAVSERFGEYSEILGVTQVALERIETGRETVMAIWTSRGTTERGLPFEQRWAWVIWVEEGLVRRFDAHMDLDAARAAAGI